MNITVGQKEANFQVTTVVSYLAFFLATVSMLLNTDRNS